MLEAFVSGYTIPVADMLESPDVVAPTARTFLAMAGLPTVHEERTRSPLFPAEEMIKFSGFCAKHERTGPKGAVCTEASDDRRRRPDASENCDY